MSIVVRSKLVKIGNSRGIRIPRALLEQVKLEDEVELIVQDERLIIQPARKPRQGWEAQFAFMAETGDDRMLDQPTATLWDAEEWSW